MASHGRPELCIFHFSDATVWEPIKTFFFSVLGVFYKGLRELEHQSPDSLIQAGVAT